MDTGMQRIISARITAQPKSLLDPLPEIYATFENGHESRLFTYHPDEIGFQSSEFIGLTEEQARQLYPAKDVAYLQSN